MQDDQLWREKVNDDGENVRSFESYLTILSQRMQELGHRVSRTTFKRVLSHYRLYVENLGLSDADLRALGPVNLDELRKVIDWQDRARAIGPGDDRKMGKDEALATIRTLLEERERFGGISPDATRAFVADRLGHAPKHFELEVRCFAGPPARYYLQDVIVSDGDRIIRLRQGFGEELLHYLTKRLGASVREL